MFDKLINNKNKTRISPLGILIILVIVLLVVAIIAPVATYFIHRSEAREVLLEAKAARLAVDSITSLDYGLNKKVADITQPYGFRSGLEDEIKELAQCEGDVYLLQWDAKAFRVKKFAYVFNGYSAIYSLDEDKPHWEIYRISSIIYN